MIQKLIKKHNICKTYDNGTQKTDFLKYDCKQTLSHSGHLSLMHTFSISNANSFGVSDLSNNAHLQKRKNVSMI